MSQFDVYLNPNASTRKFYSLILDVQSSLIADLSTRLVIPLGKLEHFNGEKLSRLTPEIEHDGEKLLVLTPQLSSMPKKLLKKPVGSLEHIRDEIVAAIDFAITGV
jgi:toxin CcdB